MSTQTSTETFADIGIPINPFPGLRPFEFDESHLFFGRDGQSEQLIGKLSRTHFLAVVGTSGSGKSSLVRAGLLPSLLGGFMTSAGSGWRVAIMRPGNDPIGNLARALNASEVFGSDIEENAAIQTAMAEATLRRGSLGLVDAVSQAVMPGDENLLVVVDQFEEIFRFARVAEGEAYGNEAAGFVKLVIEASRQRKVPIYIVLTMRSDYLGDCSQFWGLPEEINESQYLIPRLTRDQLREAIIGPVKVGGGQITPRLVNRLLNDVGDNQDQLPVLQHLLMRVWDESKEKRLAIEVDPANPAITRPHQDIHEGDAMDLCCSDAVGGMTQALSRHADEAYNELPDKAHRVVAEKLFKALTEKGADNREIRRPITLGQICAATGAGVAAVVAVIETFRQPGRSFLMPPVGTALNSESLIDISHESLIRGWTRLKGWVAEEAQSSRIYRRLAETAVLHKEGGAGLWRDPDLQIALTWRDQSKPNATWAQRYHPEFALAMSFLDASVAERDAQVAGNEARRKREIKRTRLTAVIFAVAFLFSMVTGGYAYVQKTRAQNALGEAKRLEAKAAERAVEAEKQTVIAFEAKREAEKQTGIAVAAETQAEIDKTKAISAGQLAAKRAVETAEAKSVADQERQNARRLQEETQVQTILLSGFDDLAVANYEGAASSLEKALLYFKEKKDVPKTVSTYLNLGGVYREANRNKVDLDADAKSAGRLAVDSYNEAIALMKAGAGDDERLVSTLEKAGSVWAESEVSTERREAADFYDQASAVYHRLGRKDDESARLIDVGKTFSRYDDSDSSAKAAFARAIGIYAAPADPTKIAETKLNIGSHYEDILQESQNEKISTEGDPDADAESLARQLSQKAEHEDRLRQTAASFFTAAADSYDSITSTDKAAEMLLRAGAVLGSSRWLPLKEKAAYKFEQAAEKYKMIRMPQQQATALISAGNVFREAEDKELWPRADSYYEKAVSVYHDGQQAIEEAGVLESIGQSYVSSQYTVQKRKAVAYYERAATLYHDKQSQAAEVNAYLGAAGALEYIEGEGAQATAFYDKAVAVYGNDVPKQIATLIKIGRALVRSNNEARNIKGEMFFQRAVSLAEANGGRKAAAAAYIDIGVAYQSLRKTPQSIAQFERSRSMYQEINDSLGLGLALYRLASAYNTIAATRAQAPQLTDQALALLSQALPGVEASRDQKGLADALYTMGALYMLKKDNRNALESYTRFLKMFEKVPDQKSRVLTARRNLMILRSRLDQKP